MFELIEGRSSRAQWLEIAEGGKPDWETLFTGYNACVDWPSAFYWQSLITHYPQAKVLLTMRSAESWWKSFEATILKHIQRGDDPNGFAQRLIADQVFEGRPDDRDYAISIYNRNVEEVMSTVAPERLLVHNLGDGWDPLCQFLDLPVPEVDYPRGAGQRTVDLAVYVAHCGSRGGQAVRHTIPGTRGEPRRARWARRTGRAKRTQARRVHAAAHRRGLRPASPTPRCHGRHARRCGRHQHPTASGAR